MSKLTPVNLSTDENPLVVEWIVDMVQIINGSNSVIVNLDQVPGLITALKSRYNS